MKSKFLILFAFVLAALAVFGQQKLSLNDCIQLAVDKNINVANAVLEQEKSHYKKAETRSSLLPQVEINGMFQDNTKLAVTALSMSMAGQAPTTMEISMGLQFNTTAGITLNQVLYNQTALTALKLSKKGEYASTLGVEKAKEMIAKEIAKLYFLAQTTAEQKQLAQNNIDRTQKMTDIVKKQVDNGIAKQVDYDRIMVTLQNLQTQLANTDAMHEQQLNMIKYMLEIPLENTVELTDTANMPLLSTTPVPMNDFSKHIDIQLLDAQKDIALLNQKMINQGYIPNLVFFGNFGYQGQRNDFAQYFNDNPENKWYNSSYVGLKLTVPVFDGLQKYSKYRQAKTDYMKASLTLDNTKEKFLADYKTAMNNYYNSKTTVERQQININLAEKVYQETSLKYREGLAGMSDIIQDQMGLNNAQAGYLNALYKFKEAELEIMSLNGEITKLIKN